MHLAYSAISINKNFLPKGKQHTMPENELQLRYHGYQQACDKYNREIIAIQQYLPGWVPKFR